MNNYKIYTELDEIIANYKTGKSEKIAGLYRSPFKVIKMCEYYSNSLYMGIQGQTFSFDAGYNKDALGRDKPFYNIVNFRVALAKTATDLDIKDIQITSDNPKHRIQAMLLNREAYEWMKGNFGQVLNKMGSTRPKYGGYLIKKTETKGDLKIEVVDWTKVFTDVTDIMGGPIVEEHNMSPVQIKKKDGVWENVTEVLKQNKKTKTKDDGNKITVYEVVGEFSVDIYKEFSDEESTDSDEYTYSLQKYLIACVGDTKYPLYHEELSGSYLIITNIYHGKTNR